MQGSETVLSMELEIITKYTEGENICYYGQFRNDYGTLLEEYSFKKSDCDLPLVTNICYSRNNHQLVSYGAGRIMLESINEFELKEDERLAEVIQMYSGFMCKDLRRIALGRTMKY